MAFYPTITRPSNYTDELGRKLVGTSVDDYITAHVRWYAADSMKEAERVAQEYFSMFQEAYRGSAIGQVEENREAGLNSDLLGVDTSVPQTGSEVTANDQLRQESDQQTIGQVATAAGLVLSGFSVYQQFLISTKQLGLVQDSLDLERKRILLDSDRIDLDRKRLTLSEPLMRLQAAQQLYEGTAQSDAAAMQSAFQNLTPEQLASIDPSQLDNYASMPYVPSTGDAELDNWVKAQRAARWKSNDMLRSVIDSMTNQTDSVHSNAKSVGSLRGAMNEGLTEFYEHLGADMLEDARYQVQANRLVSAIQLMHPQELESFMLSGWMTPEIQNGYISATTGLVGEEKKIAGVQYVIDKANSDIVGKQSERWQSRYEELIKLAGDEKDPFGPNHAALDAFMNGGTPYSGKMEKRSFHMAPVNTAENFIGDGLKALGIYTGAKTAAAKPSGPGYSFSFDSTIRN